MLKQRNSKLVPNRVMASISFSHIVGLGSKLSSDYSLQESTLELVDFSRTHNQVCGQMSKFTDPMEESAQRGSITCQMDCQTTLESCSIG